MKPSGRLERRTPLRSGSKGLDRGKGLARTGGPKPKPKPKAQRDAEAEVRRIVFARDGGCLMARIEPEECYGRLTMHHLRKASQGGEYTVENGVTACCHHNEAVEMDPPRYRRLGLVVTNAIPPEEALARRVAAGLGPLPHRKDP